MRVALVKPDHLGDLVLSVPAIRAAQRYFGEITLFVSHRCQTLARYLFPRVGIETINFPHLARGNSYPENLALAGTQLETYDLCLWLRNDPFIHVFTNQLKATQDFIRDDYFVHETFLQKEMLLRHLPHYSRTQLFGEHPWPEHIKRIGLSIGSGFPNNQWPMVHWLELANALRRLGFEIALIGGPAEQPQLRLLSTMFPSFSRIIVGSDDYAGFIGEIAELDLIVATDGGTAHLCSLAKPVLSIFGSSPWRRYAPFGRENVLVTRDLSCSPCCNFSMAEINGCMTRECIVGIAPDAVLAVLVGQPGSPPSTLVRRGTSHRILR